ncbi:hypothetical protein HDE68_003184 [Pedobacter cryoconitis]|uniref:Restriction endonuclease BamHI n=1 Tax=Pedobacter cryoconitis TaxID=188932 RepID=A0A7W8ZNJ1_9SPHI|nr:restriction endonuclease [Pedobacter cryoconitis]MBB5637271.1 hypothetical protein [Pedobacter cryoconitis]
MKIATELFLIKEGVFSHSAEFLIVMNEVNEAIKCVSWNEKDKFCINPVQKGNGVVPIKNNFIKYLKDKGWKTETRMTLALGMNPGPIDAIKETSFGIFAVEWETGNISSSHRALNKIGVGILQKEIIGGLLILPTKKFSKFLTDRVGNYEEISPYFILYQSINIIDGVIGVIAVEYDDLDKEAPLIPKGKDGNAKKGMLLF